MTTDLILIINLTGIALQIVITIDPKKSAVLQTARNTINQAATLPTSFDQAVTSNLTSKVELTLAVSLIVYSYTSTQHHFCSF